MKARWLVASAALVAPLALPGVAGAEAQYVSATSGPVAVGNAPVVACSGSSCSSTPPLASVGLRVGALAAPDATPPAIVAGTCPSGTGTALDVAGGSQGAVVAATLFGTRPDGSLYEQAVGDPVVLAPGTTLTVQACAPASNPLAGMLTTAVRQLSLPSLL